VAAILEEAPVAAETTVFEKGDAGDSMCIIADGRMRVSDGERTVSELLSGDVFGELALLDPEPRLFKVAALEAEKDGRFFVFADQGVHDAWAMGKSIHHAITLRAYGPRGEDVVFDGEAAVNLYNERQAALDSVR
jgi:hypothetical protein